MVKVRELVAQTKITQQELGLRMGYPPESARQSVSLFLKRTNPTIRVLVRFANAMKVKIEDLL